VTHNHRDCFHLPTSCLEVIEPLLQAKAWAASTPVVQ